MDPADTLALLHTLRDDGTLALHWPDWVQQPPPPLGAAFSADKVAGMLLGVAIGDALGRPTEAMIPARRRTLHGEVRDYHRHYRSPVRRGEAVLGAPSDDTQMTFWTLAQLLDDGGHLEPAHLSDRLARGGRILIGGGQTVRAFCANVARGLPWPQRGVDSAGNGALMRISPLLLPHLRAPSPALWADVALGAMITHNDSASTAACLAFSAMLWHLLGADQPPAADWWIDTFLALAGPLETKADYAPRGGDRLDFQGTLCDWIADRRALLTDPERPLVAVCNAVHSGAYLLESVPCVLAILTRCAHDPEEAIVRAANDTKDNDTAAAIVGAAVGALHGQDALPLRWRENLGGTLSREGLPGEVQALTARALAAFCP